MEKLIDGESDARCRKKYDKAWKAAFGGVMILLPPDSHVHSEWSWDAPDGSMVRACARAVEIGLPAVAFTEHADFTTWTVTADDADEDLRAWVKPDGSVTPPEMNIDGYLECLQRCRDQFPGLRIISGVEFGEPHWHDRAAARTLDAGGFERVLGSLHSLPMGQGYLEISDLYRHRPAAEVLRTYLAEIPRMLAGFDSFAVLAHVDYPVRYWPADAEPYEPEAFEDDFRAALRPLARTGRALEVNTQVPLHSQVLRWWHQAGGEAITFGSDAHDPTVLARGFADAAAMAEAIGFRPGRHPYDFWTRSG